MAWIPSIGDRRRGERCLIALANQLATDSGTVSVELATITTSLVYALNSTKDNALYIIFAQYTSLVA